MGNSHNNYYSSLETPALDPTHIEYLSDGNVAGKPYSLCIQTLSNRIYQQHSLDIEIPDPLLASQLSLYKLRNNNSDFFPIIAHISQFTTKSDFNCRPKATHIEVLIEHLPVLLFQTANLPFQHFLHIVRKALAGFKILHKYNMTPRIVTDQMIGLSQDGIVKMWFDPNLASNNPAAPDTLFCCEEESVESILATVSKHAQPSRMMQIFGNQLSVVRGQLTLQAAEDFLSDFCVKYGIIIPNSINISLRNYGRTLQNQISNTVAQKFDQGHKSDPPLVYLFPSQSTTNLVQRAGISVKMSHIETDLQRSNNCYSNNKLLVGDSDSRILNVQRFDTKTSVAPYNNMSSRLSGAAISGQVMEIPFLRLPTERQQIKGDKETVTLRDNRIKQSAIASSPPIILVHQEPPLSSAEKNCDFKSTRNPSIMLNNSSSENQLIKTIATETTNTRLVTFGNQESMKGSRFIQSIISHNQTSGDHLLASQHQSALASYCRNIQPQNQQQIERPRGLLRLPNNDIRVTSLKNSSMLTSSVYASPPTPTTLQFEMVRLLKKPAHRVNTYQKNVVRSPHQAFTSLFMQQESKFLDCHPTIIPLQEQKVCLPSQYQTRNNSVAAPYFYNECSNFNNYPNTLFQIDDIRSVHSHHDSRRSHSSKYHHHQRIPPLKMGKSVMSANPQRSSRRTSSNHSSQFSYVDVKITFNPPMPSQPYQPAPNALGIHGVQDSIKQTPVPSATHGLNILQNNTLMISHYGSPRSSQVSYASHPSQVSSPHITSIGDSNNFQERLQPKSATLAFTPKQQHIPFGRNILTEMGVKESIIQGSSGDPSPQNTLQESIVIERKLDNRFGFYIEKLQKRSMPTSPKMQGLVQSTIQNDVSFGNLQEAEETSNQGTVPGAGFWKQPSSMARSIDLQDSVMLIGILQKQQKRLEEQRGMLKKLETVGRRGYFTSIGIDEAVPNLVSSIIEL